VVIVRTEDAGRAVGPHDEIGEEVHARRAERTGEDREALESGRDPSLPPEASRERSHKVGGGARAGVRRDRARWEREASAAAQRRPSRSRLRLMARYSCMGSGYSLDVVR